MDDLQLHLSEPQELERVKTHARLFCRASNARFNWTKSEGILIHRPKPAPDQEFSIRWLDEGEEFRLLGLKLRNSYPMTYEDTWTDAVINFTKALKAAAWNFSARGRVTFLKTYAMPQLYYLANAVPMAPQTMQRIQTLIWKFAWKGANKGKVRREVALLPANMGGLGIPSVQATIEAIHAKWIHRLLLLHPLYYKPWAALAVHLLGNKFSEWGIQLYYLVWVPEITSRNYLPPFWEAAVKAWWKTLLPPDPSALDKEEILSQPIFLNPMIKSRTTFKDTKFLRWTEHGICKVRDLWNDGSWMTPLDLLTSYGYYPPQIDLQAIISAIPQSWKTLLEIPWTHENDYWGQQLGQNLFQIHRIALRREGETFTRCYHGPLPFEERALQGAPLVEVSRLEYLRPLWVFSDILIFRDNQVTLPSKVKSKVLEKKIFNAKKFREMYTTACVPPGMIYWNQITPGKIPWARVWKAVWKPLVPRTWNETFFLLLHKALPHGERAYKQDQDYPPIYYCPVCPQRLESLYHIFFDCTLARTAWSTLKGTWKNSSVKPPPELALCCHRRCLGHPQPQLRRRPPYSYRLPPPGSPCPLESQVRSTSPKTSFYN